jgi:hypothetical protein
MTSEGISAEEDRLSRRTGSARHAVRHGRFISRHLRRSSKQQHPAAGAKGAMRLMRSVKPTASDNGVG